MNKKINSEKAPSAIGPYSQAIETKDLVFVSGQIPIDVNTGKFAGETIEEQTKQAIENIQAILKEAGLDLTSVVKTTVLLQDIKDFSAMNTVYAEYFKEPYPARAAFEVVALPKGAKVEIEAIAAK